MIFKNINYYITVFSGSMCVMIMELAGSRMITPYLGGSIVVWTSIISVIMAGMVAGSFIGGNLADKIRNDNYILYMLAVGGIWMLLLAVFSGSVLFILLNKSVNNLLADSVVVSLLFFLVPCFCLSSVSPYIIKKCLNEKENGKIIGKLQGLSSIGSILGTLLGGFVLVVYFNVIIIFVILGMLLLLLCMLYVIKKGKMLYIMMVLCIFIVMVMGINEKVKNDYEVKSMYNNIYIKDGRDLEGKCVRIAYFERDIIQGIIKTENRETIKMDYINYIAQGMIETENREMIKMNYISYIVDNYVDKDIRNMLLLGGGYL